MRSTAPLLCLLALAGCSGDDPLTGFEGIYTVSTWTQNNDSCDAEGGSVAAIQDPLMYFKEELFFGQRFVNLVGCEDQANCIEMARDDDTLHLGGYSFDEGNDQSGWTTHNATGFESTNGCVGFVTDTRLTGTGQALRVERRTTDAAPFTGECTDEDAEAAAVGQPCTELEVITATFTTDF